MYIYTTVYSGRKHEKIAIDKMSLTKICYDWQGVRIQRHIMISQWSWQVNDHEKSMLMEKGTSNISMTSINLELSLSKKVYDWSNDHRQKSMEESMFMIIDVESITLWTNELRIL